MGLQIRFGFGILLAAFCMQLKAEPLQVITSIQPFYAITSALMLHVASPKLLLEAHASPHHYALKPSEVEALHQADLVIWAGPELETFLAKPLKQLKATTRVLALAQTPGLQLLPNKATDHHDHGGEYDMHFWLDPVRVQKIATHITQHLIALDPQNTHFYQNNLRSFLDQLRNLHQELQNLLRPVQNKPFLVFHDAYQYFVTSYDLNDKGAITEHPELPPSAKRLKDLRQHIMTQHIQCVFSEPQFTPQWVVKLAKQTGIKSVPLDPLGGTEGPRDLAYRHLMLNLATQFIACLGS